ncbi:hypothetical protein N601_08215 [Rhodococcus erythropolis DN1]|nr:hypothetical protein N601_08215 [Rhodococcus erythropolis DN1]
MYRADPEKNCRAATLVESDHRSSMSFVGAERAVQISGCVDTFPISDLRVAVGEPTWHPGGHLRQSSLH